MFTWRSLDKREIWAFLSEKRIYIISIVLALFLIFLIRSCSTHSSKSLVYHIGRDVQWHTLNLMGKERNLTAFSDRLLLSISEEEGIRFELSSTPYDLLTRLEAKQFDGVLESIQPTPQLEHFFAFSEPYFLTGPVLIVLQESKFNKWEEIKYKIIGILASAPPILEIASDSTIQLKLYDNMLQALADLDNHRIDGVILPALPAYIYTKTFYPDRLKVATAPLSQEGLRLIALNNKAGKTLIEHFNKGLTKLKNNGTYKTLLEDWGLVNANPNEKETD